MAKLRGIHILYGIGSVIVIIFVWIIIAPAEISYYTSYNWEFDYWSFQRDLTDRLYPFVIIIITIVGFFIIPYVYDKKLK